MRKKPRDNDKIVIQKMLDYCDKIEILINRFGNTFEDYISDVIFQFSNSMLISKIGELATQISEDFKNQHSEIAWIQIESLRNIHAHNYNGVDFGIMWQTLNEDIPALKKSLQAILEVM